MRLELENPFVGPNEAVTTLGVPLPSGGGWTHAVFPITPADLTILVGDATALLSNMAVLRLLHSPTPSEAVPIGGVLGVDNITALARPVPESPVLALVALGVLALIAVRAVRR